MRWRCNHLGKSPCQKAPLSLRERVGVRANERRSRSGKPAGVRATLTPDPSPAKRERGDFGIRSKFVFALTAIIGVLLPGGPVWANSETGPELFAPDIVLLAPTVDPAPKPEGQSQAVPGGSTMDQASSPGDSAVSKPAGAASLPDDGWVTKGSRSQLARPGGGQASAATSSIKPPPASLPAPQVLPQTPGPTYGGGIQATGIPYPYGTPAPVPQYLGRSWPGQTGLAPRPILGGKASQSHGFLASVGRWWNSLWGKKPLEQPAGGSFNSSTNSLSSWNGAGTSHAGNVVPWSGSAVGPPASGTSGGSTSPQVMQPYATPYALPPNSSQGSALSSPPLTAGPAQSGTGGQAHTTLMPPHSTTEGTAKLVTPGTSAGSSGAPGTLGGNVYGGWTATPQAASVAPSSPQMRSTLPPYPHYGSGFGTALPFPRASEPPAALWNGGAILPRKQTDGRSLMDRLRAWWADVTAPKGIQGRQALLPPSPSDGRILGVIPRRNSVPTTDPFSSYGGGTVSPGTPQAFGTGMSYQPPAAVTPPVLP